MYQLKDIMSNNTPRNSINTTNTECDYIAMALECMMKNEEIANKSLIDSYRAPITEDSSLMSTMATKSVIILIDQCLSTMDKMITLFDKELSKFFSKKTEFISNLKKSIDLTDKLGKSTMNIEGFLYTEMKQPNIWLSAEFATKYPGYFSNVDGTYKQIRDYYNNKYMDVQRSKSLHTDYNISEKNYMNEVYKYFRNNCSDVSVIAYRQDHIEDMIRKYIDYKVYIDNLRELYDEIVEQCKSVKYSITTLEEGNYTPQSLNYALYGQHTKNVDLEIPEGFIGAVASSTRLKISSISHFMNMYLTVMSAKITAMKSSVYQNTALLDSFMNFASVQENAREYYSLDISYSENGYLPVEALVNDIKRKFNLDINDIDTADNDNLSRTVTYLCNIPARVLSGFAIITKVICPIADMIRTVDNISESTINMYIELLNQICGDEDVTEVGKGYLVGCIDNMVELL